MRWARPDRATARTRLAPWRWPLLAVGTAVLVAAYFELPLGHLGPDRPALSWTVFSVALVLIAALLLRQIRNVLTERGDTRSGLAIAGLMSVTVLVFATAYSALARQPGEFDGLETRVDALYFTVVTLATVGYGDISPSGQSARVVAMVQIVYTFAFLTSAATALSRHVRSRLEHSRQDGEPED
ncbi:MULTISPECIES: potassium channel family protein [unclassified Streptomyces]|uniref:potassium channel family protein n=1 Tax=unclassified Streptomyces TaxID=2593676 RepID=UPI0022B62D54|nr:MULTISPECIES: potassium channel family protein [unclassified Streptomyces]MCZ7413933.1 potassium channel family protein [Streptomyces sp. WMMC897]MCZ7430929.1 potassium channel family protein [Streptomyces sp. WMMC1477]